MAQHQFTAIQRCDHCGHRGAMEIVATHTTVETIDEGHQGSSSESKWIVYEMMSCPACRGVSLRSYPQDSVSTEPFEADVKRLYPRHRDDRVSMSNSVMTSRFRMDAKELAVLFRRLQIIHECNQ